MRKKIVRILGILVVVLAGVYGVLAWRAKPVAARPFFANQSFMVIAHQGGEGLRPSNTMAAFSNAMTLGVDVLEMDIHLTADGEIVVMHDDTVDRTTNGTGAIKEMTLAQIKALDAGDYWTDDDGRTHPYRGQGITVPTLREVFEAFPDMPMNIEIKQKEPPMVEPFCALIREYGMADRVLAASFHPEAMTAFRETCPEVATSMVEDEIRPFFVLNLAFVGGVYAFPGEALQVPEYSGNLHVVTPRFVRTAQRQNVAVHVWTVNDPADMQRMLELGVDGIITDRPDLLLDVLGR
ncbi:MAG: glycerophosphodiester phosphodiesterase [Anaerolineae bacterium]